MLMYMVILQVTEIIMVKENTMREIENMKIALIKRFVAVILVCLMVIGSSVTVFAGSSYSTWETTTVLGYTYEYCSIALQRNFTSGNTLEAVAMLNTENNYTNVPIGYMGAQARLMTPDLSTVYTGGDVYNWVSSAGVVAYSPSTTDDSKIFYSKSKIYLYNGNGYDEYEANASPYTMITRSSGDVSIDNTFDDTSGLLTNIYSYETEYDEMAKESEYIGKVKIIGIENGSMKSDVSTCKCKVEVLVKGEHLREGEDGTIFINVINGIVSAGDSYIIGFDKTDDTSINYTQTPKTYIYGFGEDLIRKIIGRCVYFRTGKVTENYLIPATGRDGTEGYVWDDDLSPTPKTIEEAIELTKKASTEQIIPLYNLYGEVIGEYVIGAVTVEGIEEILDEMNQ